MAEELGTVTAAPGADSAGTAPTAPDVSASSPAAEPAAPSEPSAGTPRGPDGRFTSAATQPPAPPPDGADPSAPAALDTTTTEPTPPAPTPNAAAQPQPFTFRASGQRVPLEGAVYEPGKGLTVPETALPQLRRMLAHGHEYATAGVQREREYRHRIAELEAAQDAAQAGQDAETEVYKAWFLEILGDPSGAKLLEAVQNFGNTSALLSERAARAKLETQLKAREAARPAEPQVTPEQQEQRLAQAVVTVATDFVEEMKESGAYGALTDADWQYLAESASENPIAFVRQHEGEQVFDGAMLLRWAKKQQADRAEAATRTQQVAKAAEYNAKRQAAPPAPKAPPPAKPEPADEPFHVRHAKKQEEGRAFWERMGVG